MKKITGLFMVLLLLTACGSVPLTGRKQILLVSDSEVLNASLTQYSDYIKTAPKSTNKTYIAEVERVGKKIAAATEQYLKNNGLEAEIKNFAWEFNTINSADINAFCMPGGKIVVYEGLLKLISSEDELATVMGHEVAHAVARHSNERMSQEIVAQYGAAILDQAFSNKSAAIQQVGVTVFGLGAQGGILAYSRKHELEADYMGLVLMTMAGYDPNKALTFWEKMSAATGNAPLELLSTHPSDSRRIAQIRQYLPEMEKYKAVKK
ncbi:MAG: M48 family metallopeptidase [Tannerella sp.]|jgi:predicted Zn-dependent protease|nr:M48 family metallopeptidase [Tannerella sp.]